MQTDQMNHDKRFGEGPDSGEAGLSVPARLMDSDWCGLVWTPWTGLKREARQIAPTVFGIYRVCRLGSRLARLTYIVQTGCGLRDRLPSLAASFA
jgi:hypothetical protein